MAARGIKQVHVTHCGLEEESNHVLFTNYYMQRLLWSQTIKSKGLIHLLLTVNLCDMSTTLHANSDVNTSKALLAQQQKRLQQLKETKPYSFSRRINKTSLHPDKSGTHKISMQRKLRLSIVTVVWPTSEWGKKKIVEQDFYWSGTDWIWCMSPLKRCFYNKNHQKLEWSILLSMWLKAVHKSENSLNIFSSLCLWYDFLLQSTKV